MYVIFDRLMKQRNVTRYRVSQETGVAESSLSDWKNGKSMPKIDKMQKIAEYFGVTVDYLMGKEKPVTDDDELNKYLEELRTRPEMRMLFSVSEGCTKEEVEQAVKIIEALRK